MAKKDKFYDAINHYAEEQRQKIEEEIQSFKQKELEETEIEVLTECYHLIQSEMCQMRIGISRDIAQREMDARRKLLEKRQKIEDEIFSRAQKQLLEFVNNEKYAGFLERTAHRFSETFHQPGTVICLKEEDHGHEALIQDAFGSDCTFQTDPAIHIGGIKAYHPDMGLLADETLDTLLESQYEWFEQNSGLNVV